MLLIARGGHVPSLLGVDLAHATSVLRLLGVGLTGLHRRDGMLVIGLAGLHGGDGLLVDAVDMAESLALCVWVRNILGLMQYISMMLWVCVKQKWGL